MTALYNLAGDLSWTLKAAWLAWGAWIVFQIAWRRRARMTVLTTSVASVPARFGGRLTLGIAAGPDPDHAAVAPQAPIEMVEAATEPSAPVKRPKRRRHAARAQTAPATA